MIDVVVIGAGPSGLFSVFMCGMQKLKCHIIDPLPFIGGQCAALYPEKPIYDIPAYPSISAGELINQLKKQIEPFQPEISLGEKILSIKKIHAKEWLIEGDRGTVIKSRSIIIAAGAGAFGPNRPPLKNIYDFEPHCIHYAVTDRLQYTNKHLVIAGGGDSAVDWAINLCQIAASVSIVHRRDKFRCHPGSEDVLKHLVEKGKISLIAPYQLDALEGQFGQLKAVQVKSLSDDTKRLPADFLLAFFGLSTDLGAISEWGLSIDKKHISVDPTTSATSQSGVYAVGDISSYPHKNKLILCGFAEAAQAAHAIRRFLYPDERTHFEYSTTSGIPNI